MLLTTLKKIENFEKLKAEVLNIVSLVGADHTQIMCQVNEAASADWLTGVGRISELKTQDEFQYNHLNPALNGTEIARLITEHGGVRTRIMTLKPRSCYSVHADPTQRIHIPIITNAGSWMVWPHNHYSTQLTVGYSYLTDTTKPHTFFNGGTEDRIHLVMCVSC
jgi:hypothetical protein